MKISEELKIPISKLDNIQFNEQFYYYSDELSPPILLKGIISNNILYAYYSDDKSKQLLAIYLISSKAEIIEVGWSKEYMFCIISRVGASYQFGVNTKVFLNLIKIVIKKEMD